jgi:hypothetical protein
MFGRSVDELEAALLEAGDDVSDESALDAVGLFNQAATIDGHIHEQRETGMHLDHDVCALVIGRHD